MAEPTQPHPTDGELRAALLREEADVRGRIGCRDPSDFLACRTPAAFRVLERRIGQV